MQKLKVEKDSLDAELQRIRIKAEDKARFEAICATNNVAVASAIRSFIRAVIDG